MSNIRVAICDDAIYLCNNFKNFLKYEDDIEFAGYALSSSDCQDMIRDTAPDVLLLDIQMETETAGIDILPKLTQEFPDLKIIMLTSFDNDDYIFSSLVNGATDYILKSGSMDEITEKIRKVFSNDSSFSPKIAARFKSKSQELASAHKSLIYMINIVITLSISEFEVLKAIYNGKSYKDIAKERYVEDCTIRSMCSRILKKFKVKSIHELINHLRESKLFDLYTDL